MTVPGNFGTVGRVTPCAPAWRTSWRLSGTAAINRPQSRHTMRWPGRTEHRASVWTARALAPLCTARQRGHSLGLRPFPFWNSGLEHFHQTCSDVLGPEEPRSFWFLTSFQLCDRVFNPAHSPKPRQKSRILAAHRYIFSVNALTALAVHALESGPEASALQMLREV